MAKPKGKLLAALAAEKGTDFQKVKEKRKAKEHRREKRQKSTQQGGAKPVELEDDEDEDEWEEEEDSDAEGNGLVDDEAEEGESDEEDDDEEDAGLDIDGINDTDSDSSMEFEEKIQRPDKKHILAIATKAAKKAASKVQAKRTGAEDPEDDEEEEAEEEEEEDEDVAWSDLEDLPEEEKEDFIRHQRLSINNTLALTASLKRIAIPTNAEAPFVSHQSIFSAAPTADGIPDPQDDLERELKFYAQALDATRRARDLLRKEGVPFSRPKDYFAEMVKDDGHMEKVKGKLVEEASAKKASAEARKQREFKKFGKQVQVAKLQERQKAKKDTLDKIKSLKRKRQDSSNDLPSREADLFDVSVDNELKKHGNKRGAPSSGRRGEGGAPNVKRQKKDAKYGFGGKKRHAKSGDAISSGDLSGFSTNRMKGRGGKPIKATRPGKARRKAAGGRP